MNVSLPPRLVKDKPRRPLRLRCPAHLSFVRSHACSVPGCDTGDHIEAAHVRQGTDGGMGMKPGDHWTISLCQFHHAQQHANGEMAFQDDYRLDMKALAAAFWSAFKKEHPQTARRAERRAQR